jgi:hypothetical protein
MKSDYIGTNEFRLAMPITKSYEKEREGVVHQFVAGLATGVDLDLDGERMAQSAIQAFKKAIDEGIALPNGKWSYVPLRTGHGKEWHESIGWITKAEIDEHHNLWIEAELDSSSSIARDLFQKLSGDEKPGKPLQLGLSVGGSIRKASREWDQNLGRAIRVIEDVVLKEISVVGSPAYPTAYVEALSKSVNWDEVPPHQNEVTDLMKEQIMLKDKAEEATTEAEVVDVNTTTTVTEVTTEVTKATEEAQADPTVELRATVEGLQTQVSELVTAVSQLVTAGKSHNKSENEEPVTKTEKVETVDFADTITKAVAAALATFKADHFDALVTDMQTVKSTVEEFAAAPMDKSFAVRRAKETEGALEKFKSQVNANDPIGSAVRFALGADE